MTTLDNTTAAELILTPEQAASLRYASAGMYHREADPCWNEKRDAALGIKPVKEFDPYGKKFSDPGSKGDAGKNRLGLVMADFANAIQQVGLVATLGALKYTASGWVSVANGKERYTDALFRHLVAHAKGEKLDASGLLHLAHAAWNCLAVLELELRTPTAEQRLERK